MSLTVPTRIILLKWLQFWLVRPYGLLESYIFCTVYQYIHIQYNYIYIYIYVYIDTYTFTYTYTYTCTGNADNDLTDTDEWYQRIQINLNKYSISLESGPQGRLPRLPSACDWHGTLPRTQRSDGAIVTVCFCDGSCVDLACLGEVGWWKQDPTGCMFLCRDIRYIVIDM